MNQDQLIDLLIKRFQTNIANQAAAEIVTSDDMELLYELSNINTLPRPICGQVNFRAAYVLEYIFETRPELFAPFEHRFLDDFVSCSNDSAKRHYSKDNDSPLAPINPYRCTMRSHRRVLCLLGG